VNAEALAEHHFGDAIYTNMIMLGMAWQNGLIPVSDTAIYEANRLNKVKVAQNAAAFDLGRLAAVNPDAVQAMAPKRPELEPPTLDELIARRAEMLRNYQNAAYADMYEARVARVRAAESNLKLGEQLTRAAATYLAKLMAYKDEYEVARLYTDGGFRDRLAQQFEGDVGLKVHLAPPLWAKRDPATGHLKKQAYGAWVLRAFGLLAKFKGLRGTALDPFGRTAERRAERGLIAEYESQIAELLEQLSPANHAAAVALASLPEAIRGFGHVKDASIAKAAERRAELIAAFRNPPAENRAAQ
jgi:indolepyruvate ferredoxin oxidoreductase